MRALVQRVSSASVTVDGEVVGAIGPGLLVLLGVRRGDDRASAERLVRKLLALRVFEDEAGRMNLAAADVGAEFLCVSNFTLYGDARKGNRPSFVDAAPPDDAEPLYELVREGLGAQGGKLRRAHGGGARERRTGHADRRVVGAIRTARGRPHRAKPWLYSGSLGLSSAAGRPHLKVGFAAHLFFAQTGEQ